MKKLVCIYTCDRDKQHLANLKQTDWYKQVINDDNTTVLEVYADPTINEDSILEYNDTTMKSGTLIVKAEEVYNKLSIKTYQMIKACVSLEKFDYLIKVDVSYGNDKHHSLLAPQHHYDHFINNFNDEEFYKEYNGVCHWENIGHTPHRFPTAMRGVSKKLLPENFSFYAGKCYVIDYNFSKYIATHGEETAHTFAAQINGAEDLMIFKLHESYNFF